jgi:hypothetical protein
MRRLPLPSALRSRVVPIMAVILAASLLPASAVVTSSSPPSSPRPPAPTVREAQNTRGAVVAAVAQRKPVRVAELTTSTRVVDAQPDGTLTATLSAQPVRVRQDGRWVDVDTTLVRRPDGTIGPRAVEVELTLSGGGAGTPMVSYGKDGKRIVLTWPGTLPAPRLSGSTATYPDVLPGVDLVLRAEVDGYAQHLVVKNAQAARNPALRRIRLGLSTKSLRVTSTRTGALEARDAKGALVFAAPPSAMWDGAAKTAVAAVAVDRASLNLVPDQALLTGPKTRFPVVVDPTWGSPGRTGWTKVFSGKPNTAYWNGGNDADGWAKVGYCGWSGCNGIGAARSYFQFDTVFLAGKQILSAAFNATIVYGPSCNTRNHQLFMATGGIDGGTTWNNAPQGWLVDTRGADSNYNGCTGNKPIGFNVSGALNGGGYSTYFIKAEDEGDAYAWRKYDGWATTVVVNYNTQPNQPTNLRTDPPLAAPCHWCAGKYYYPNTSIRLMATLTDPDGDNLRPLWRTSTNGTVAAWDGAMQANGATHDTNVDLRNSNGKEVGWWVHGSDDTQASDAVGGPGPFVVDLDGPGSTPWVTGQLYQDDNRWHGGVGVPGQFTFSPVKPGVPGVRVDDIDHYLYGFQDPPTTAVDASALGGPATVTLAPPGDGPRTLYVQSVDRAGHPSATQPYRFYVRAGSGPLAQWSLDGNATDTAFLGDRDGTLSGGGSYQPGAVDLGLQLDGTGQVVAPNTVRTDASFSVTAWAKVAALDDRFQTVVSQHGANTCAFCLQYQGDKKAWVFVLPQTDQATPPGWSFVQAPATAGEWTHLAGVYDAEAKKVRLYVNGRLAGSAPHTTPWNGADVLRIGTAFAGGVDEVKLYDRVLSDAEVSAEVSRDNVQLGHWKFDRAEGSTAPNAVPGGTAAVLRGNARYVTGAVNQAVQLDSTNDYVSTGAPVLRTDRSFTIGGWMRLDQLPPATGTSTAVSQFGAVNSGFYLGYRNNNGGQWEFYLPSADTVDRPSDSVVSSAANTAKVGEWAHVMGVYVADPANPRIEIYVNGKLAGSAARGPGFQALGELIVGRGQWQNGVGNNWLGAVDELRAYSRALSAAEIQGLVAQSGVTAGSWHLDGDAVDSSGRGLGGTVGGSADWTGGQSSSPEPNDLAVRLNGTTGYVSAPHAVDTSRSFSAAAWVRLDEVGGHYGVVSQDGATTSAFKVEAEPGGRWSFAMFTQDVNGGGVDHRAIGGAAQVGVWTHLVGVYDAGSQLMSLYVNGVLAASVAHSNAWDYPTGALQIGRNKWGGAAVDYFPGAIDDVSVYSRPLFADEIRTMAGRDLSLVHDWALDESSGTSAADAIGTRRGALSSGAAFAPGRAGNAVALDGRGGAVSTTGVDLRTDASFTVSAWALLTAKDCDLNQYTECKVDAVTIDGNSAAATGSKFRLGHVVNDGQSLNGAWTFEMPESDKPDAPVTKAVVTTDPSEVGHWVHLVGVYDAPARKIWLYVNGIRIGDGTLNTPWQATGGLQIGRGRAAGQPGEYWPGKVDDVRLYTGVLDKDRVYALYRSYPAQEGPANLPVADAGQWKFDENAGTTAADASGKGHPATLKGGAGWIGGRNGYATWLDGTSGYAETTGPVLDTSRSFTVSAWVYFVGDATANRTVIGQDGNRLSTFILQYKSSAQKWAAVVPTEDKDNPTNVVALTSTEAAAVGDWTHLTMAYDSTLHQLRLYVNGVLSAAQTGVTVLGSAGPLSIGRARWNGGNVDYFPRGIDDVRVYGRALSDGEVRKVHDDAATGTTNVWKFDDGTGRDYSWQKNNATVSGSASFPASVSGKAIQLDGVSADAEAMVGTQSMRDSFTVSAWARLSRTDQLATVLGRDGARMSGYVLQYRPALRRWVFAAPSQDADSADLVYAASLTPPVANQWTHLAGVYDYPAHQLRLYVDGKLAGVRSNVVLWQATGAFTIGRGKFNGQPANFFPGTIDEPTTVIGAASDAEIARRAGWPAPVGGQLGRFVNTAGEHYTGSTSAPIRDGYHFEGTLGALVAGAQPNARTLYACLAGQDGFTSADSGCEGQTVVGVIGQVYAAQPTNIPTVAVYRCNTGADHFESRRSDCEGATVESILGYTPAYAALPRYYNDRGAVDHMSTVDGTPPGYWLEGSAGLVSLVAQAGTQPLMSCQDDTDQFVSTDPNCEGRTVLANIGQVWTAAPAVGTSWPIYRCIVNGQRYVSKAANCEGYTMDRQIGYVMASQPDVAPVFS